MAKNDSERDTLIARGENCLVKCSKPSFCGAMYDAFGYPGAKRGFDRVTAINIKDGTMRLIGVRYCETPKDKGIMLNFCPWCGESLQWWGEGE